jgi:hypothetical protein
MLRRRTVILQQVLATRRAGGAAPIGAVSQVACRRRQDASQLIERPPSLERMD